MVLWVQYEADLVALMFRSACLILALRNIALSYREGKWAIQNGRFRNELGTSYPWKWCCGCSMEQISSR